MSLERLFYGLACKMQWVKGWDPSSQNPSLPNYLTYDYDALWREDAVEWTEMGYKENELKMVPSEYVELLEDVTEEDRREIVLKLTRTANKIVDSGHFLYRSICILGWGFSGAGYFDEDEMQEILFNIVDENDYLSTKPNVYKRTCLDMKAIGMGMPLYLERHEKV